MKSRREALVRLTPIAMACMAALAPSTMASAAVVTWVGPSASFWDLATNWSPAAVPTTTSDVKLGTFDTVFRTGAVTVNSFVGTGRLTVTGGSLRATTASSLGALTMSGGTLSGAGTVTTGSLSFLSGVMGESAQGGGVTTVNGTTTFDGAGNQYLYYGRTLNLKGADTWTAGAGSIYIYSGGQGTTTLNIGAATTFTDAGTAAAGQTRYLGYYGDGVINNAGTYTRNGLGSTIASAFNNTGTVNVAGGTMSLNVGGTSTGAFSVASGAALAFGGGTYLLNGGSLVNAGTVQLNGGILRAQATLTTSGAGTFQLNGGTLGNLVANPFTIASKFSFTSGTIGETGQAGASVRVTGATTFDGTHNQQVYYGHVLNLAANSSWTAGNGAIILYSGGQGTTTLNIGAGTTLADAGTASAGQTRYLGYYSDGLVNNGGTYSRTGLGTTQVSSQFANTGSVAVHGGTLNIVSGGSSTGAMSVDSGASLAFGNGLFSLKGSLTNNGTVQVNAGTVRVQAPLTTTGTGSFQLLGGTLAAVSPFTIATPFRFGAGTLGESGRLNGVTTVTGGTTFDGTTSENIRYGSTLNLNSNDSWTAGAGAIGIYSGSQGPTTMNIAAATTFTDAGTANAAQTRYLGYYADGVVNNAGTYVRNGLGTTQVDADFNNTGTVQVNAGILNFVGGGTSSASFATAAGATLGFGGSGSYFFSGGSLVNNGTLQVSSNASLMVLPSFTLSGPGVLQVAGGELRVFANSSIPTGSLSMTGGYLSGPGTVTVGSLSFVGGIMGESGFGGGVTTVNGAATFDGTGSQSIRFGRTLNLKGNDTWTAGAGVISLLNSGQGTTALNIAAGTTFTDAGTAAPTQIRYLGYYNDGTVNNAGTYARNGLGTTEVDALFMNTGTVRVNAGTLNFTGGGTSVGSFATAAGATLSFGGNGSYIVNGGTFTNSGTLQVAGNASVIVKPSVTMTGTGGLSIAGGEFRSLADLTNASMPLTMSGGTLSGNGTVTVGNLTFGGGTMGESGWGGGVTTVTGTTTIDGTASQNIRYGRTLNLNGNDTWTAGGGAIGLLSSGQGPTSLNIAAATTFTDAGTASAAQTRYLGYYNDGTINNKGTYARNGLGTTEVDAQFMNTGTVRVNAGTMNLVGGGTSTASFVTASGATLGFGGNGSYLLTGGSIANTGTVLLSGNASVMALPSFTLAGTGALNIAGGEFRALTNLTDTTALLTMTGGNLSGIGTLTFGSLAFNGGTMGESGWGGGTTVITGASTFSGTVNENIYYGRKLNLNGNSSWTAGTGAIVISSSNQGASALNLAVGTTFTDAGTSTAAQTRYLGYYGDGSVNNAATYLRNGLGTTQVNSVFTNTGTVQVNAGNMSFLNDAIQGTGTLQIGAAGSVVLANGDSTVGRLIMQGGPGSLNIGANQVVVSSDYNNAAFGVGNAFNRLANITLTGTGQHIIASGNVGQALSGTLVTNGTTATPTLTIGNVHVGGQALSYSVVNTGTSGPSLRGASQSAVNGGSITDTRLTGNGINGNWGPVAPGASLADSFNFTVATAGIYTPVAANQIVSIVNNFENTNHQVLKIVSSANAAAYNLANASVTPTSVAFAAQRIGGTLSKAITIGNTAPVSTYSEKLDAAFGANVGAALNNAGVVSLLAPAATNATAMVVRLNTSAAGAKTGSATLTFNSDGSGTSGLGLTARPNQSVAVSGSVYAPAVAKINTPTVDFGIVHKGDVVAAKAVSISNTATVVAGYNDTLLGSISGGAPTFTTSGTLAGVAAGATDASSLKVALNTATTGSFTGTATVALSSHDAALSDLSLGTTNVALKGQVNSFAQAAFAKTTGSGTFSGSAASYTINFGTLKAGATALTANLSVLNTATGFADVLNGSFLTTGIGSANDFAISGFNSFASIAAGSSFSGLSVAFGGTTLGSFDKVVTLKATGSNASGYSGALADIQLHLVGTVNATGVAAAAIAFPQARSFSVAALSMPVAAVPEPSTYLLMLQGGLMIGFVGWRKSRRRDKEA